MKKIFFRPESILLILLILITYSFVWQKDNWQRNILSSDGRGYYAYLPAVILYHDLTYESNSKAIEKELGYEMTHHYILQDENGETFNKTFPGVAICLTPLFLLATFLSFLSGNELNGYNDIYLICIQLSAILACLIGYYHIKKLLLLHNIKTTLAILIPAIGIFGTNIYYYACNGASMGHIYSFMMMSVFLYHSLAAMKKNKLKNYIICSLSLAMIVLIRPTNGIIVFLLPLLAGDFHSFKCFVIGIFKQKKILFLSLLSGSLIILTLPLIWFLQTNHFIVWSYSGEGFNFTKPLIHKVLFSFRNGMFVYAPISFLLFGGIAYTIRKNKFAGFFTSLYFIVNVYIISSWWTFYYGGGFGHRAMAEHHVFSILMIAILVNEIGITLQKVFYGLSVLLVSLSIFQGFQTNKGILPSDYVNAEMYGLLFLKWDDKYIGECNATLDCRQYGEIVKTEYIRPINFENEFIVSFDENREFGGDASYSLPEVGDDIQFFMEFNYQKKRNSTDQFDDVVFVLDCKGVNDETIYYEAKPLYHIRSEALNEFKQLKLTLQLPRKDIVKYNFYIWNKGRKSFEIKDIDIKVLLIKS